MKVNKVVFSCENMNHNFLNKQELKKMDVVFDRGKDNPVLLIECEDVKIEDRSLPINCEEVLKEIGKIDFDLKNNILKRSEYSGKKWSLSVDDEVYEGVFDDPYYIIELKRVLKYSSIELYSRKKVANYFKK